MMNNMKLKRERSRESLDIDLMWFDNLSMSTRESGYIFLFNDLGLQHNIIIGKP
jgi:hypothetical protein